MELPATVVKHLRELVADVEADSGTLVGSLTDLAADVHAVIASYRGLVLTLLLNGWPITLVAFTPDDTRPVITSLRLPLEMVDSAYEAGSSIVFYAAAPGALVDLAADLSHVLGAEVRHARATLEHDGHLDGHHDGHVDGHHDGHVDGHHVGQVDGKVDGQGGDPASERRGPTIDLDTDLPPASQRSGITGLAAYSEINRAIGTLIEQGHAPEEAQQTLRRRAAAVGLEPRAYARRLLTDS